MARINEDLLKNKNWKPLNFAEIKNPALFIIDMVYGFTDEGAMSDKAIAKIIPNINKIMDITDKLVYIKEAHGENDAEFETFPKHCVEGTKEAEIVDELVSTGLEQWLNSTIIKKCSTNGIFSFIKDEKALEIIETYDSFVFTGCCTDICVMQFVLSFITYLNEHGYRKDIYVPIDCVDTYHIEGFHDAKYYNEVALDLMEKAGAKIVEKIL